jgi:hypothetical protein
VSGRGAELPAAFEAIAEALDEPAGRVTFIRGLMVGTLVGAAVVGSLLRARQARRPPPARPLAPGETVTLPVEDEAAGGR